MKKFSFRSLRPLTVGLTLSALTFAAVAHAAIKSVGAGDSGFLAVGPAGLKIEGTGKGVSAKEAGGKIIVSAPLTNLKTGISLRDKHLKDAINTKGHPTATFTVARSALKFPGKGKSAQGSGSGSFKLNGVAKSIPFKYKSEEKGGVYTVQGHATVDITQHKLEQPCYLGVCVDKKVKVKVKFKVKFKVKD